MNLREISNICERILDYILSRLKEFKLADSNCIRLSYSKLRRIEPRIGRLHSTWRIVLYGYLTERLAELGWRLVERYHVNSRIVLIYCREESN
ncbi:MAG: hypothetical protein GXO26_04600 [Crenarchaeota archaeon]|nr:hypothetical protein [Thermoproteota archaeon]